MYDIGRVCLKIAGRDAGQLCVIINVLDDNYVLIDGFTRKRKCNITHIEPLKQTIDISKNESKDAIIEKINALNITF
jgi:large subunit ribosomal protein L14e